MAPGALPSDSCTSTGWKSARSPERMDHAMEIVYVVDDDPTVREALSSLLRSYGKDVRLFESGLEFLSFERADTSACLILDLKMPDVNGLEVQKLLAENLSIP